MTRAFERVACISALLLVGIATSVSAQDAVFDPDVPPFCQSEATGHADAGGGHPEHGGDWCARQAWANDVADGPAGAAASSSSGDRALEPFCRPGGQGHPEFGMQWCFRKQAERSGAAAASGAPRPAGVERDAAFCREGGAHPEHGRIWCTMTEDEWDAYQREREREPAGSAPR